jgi:cell division protein YceG involved in septum cleavage
LSRGERSRPERTSEERQHDREERERRRAARAGETPPASAVPEAPAEADPVAPPEPISPDSPAAEAPAAEAPAAEAPAAEASAAEAPAAQAPAAELPAAEAPAAEPPTIDPVSPESVGAEPTAEEELLIDAIVPELPGEEPPAEASMTPEAAAEAPDEPVTAALEPVAPAAGEPGLPPPPRRVDERPREGRSARAGAEEAAGVGRGPAAALSSGGGPRRAVRAGRAGRGGGLPHGSRLIAVIALLAVAAVVVLLVHSLKSSKAKPVAVTPAVKVLIPEGKTRLQIAQIAKAAGLKGSYRTAAHSSNRLDPTQYGAPRGTPDLEGFLFPATYDMERGGTVSRLVAEQLEAFTENFSSEDVSRAKALHVTPYQLLIVASMIEREAQVPSDRAKIAAVIYNRLAQKIPLGIDAAIYYAVESAKGIATYTGELTESQLKINSPYNTRTHTGLPPTPISNPGVASIQAAAHPSHAAYLYYVAGADGCGEQVFSDTQAQFEANVAAYEAAKRKNGGHPPKCKHG